MKWLRETHGTKFELVRHFFQRTLEGESAKAAEGWQRVAVGVAAMLLPLGMLLFDQKYISKYRILSSLPAPESFRAAAMADELALLTLACALTGLLAVLRWQALFPTGRDCLALAALPIRPRQIFAGRFTTFLLLATAVVIAINALPSLAVPLVMRGRWQKNPSFLVNAEAQAVAAGVFCFFVLFAAVAVQGLLLNLLPAKWFARVSVYVQGGLAGVLFFSALFSSSISDWDQHTIARLPEFGGWAPPVWYLGLHEWLLGDRTPFITAMAHRALIGISAAILLAVLTYIVSYRRYARLLLEAPVHIPNPRKRRWSLAGLFTSDPRQQAVLQFMSNTLSRSRSHRLILLAYLAVACGFLANAVIVDTAGLRASYARNLLLFGGVYGPLAFAVLTLNGLRHAFSVPVEVRANWLFQITESQGRTAWMRATERFVILCALVPIQLAALPLSIGVLGWRAAVRCSILEFLVCLIVFEFLFSNWQKMPFTCTYVPGKKPVVMVVAIWVGVMGAAVPMAALVTAWVGFNTIATVILGGLLTAAWLRARKLRRDGWGEGKLVYEDVLEPVPGLGLVN